MCALTAFLAAVSLKIRAIASHIYTSCSESELKLVHCKVWTVLIKAEAWVVKVTPSHDGGNTFLESRCHSVATTLKALKTVTLWIARISGPLAFGSGICSRRAAYPCNKIWHEATGGAVDIGPKHWAPRPCARTTTS